MRRSLLPFLSLLALTPACTNDAPVTDDDSFNEAADLSGKLDTGYQTSLDAREVEVTLQGKLTGVSAYDLERAPLDIGQFALTYLRKNNDVYLQSLAEDYAHGTDQIEWLVGTKWTKWNAIPAASRAGLTDFRMTKISTVVMHPGNAALLKGKTYKPVVPKNPGSLWATANDACAEQEGSIEPGQEVYWYTWVPERAGCKAEWKTTATVTIDTVLPAGPTTYPEYDRLTADKKVDVLVLFGQVDHGTLSTSDYSFTAMRALVSSLTKAGFKKGTTDIGVRYTRTQGGLTENVDIYGPKEFSGLDDYAHIANFDKGINSHEVIVYNGHSMLGASDFWARKSIYADPKKYQIFLYNGCLGYEYYVNPIVEGHQGFDNVDLVSNVLETPFSIMVQETATPISMIMYGAEHNGTTSWQSILTRMNQISGSDALYGASGIRTNMFMPRH